MSNGHFLMAAPFGACIRSRSCRLRYNFRLVFVLSRRDITSMELKTQALDRLLEALTPALTAELDRVVAETREALEQEFQKRLQSAVREAENEVRSAAEAQLSRGVADAGAQLN